VVSGKLRQKNRGKKIMVNDRPTFSDPLLSVVMPVFNERETVERIVGRVLAVPLRIELIVIDDGSTDGTKERLEALQLDHKFRLIINDRNMGKGFSIRSGFKEISGDVVVIQDADLEYSPEEFPQLIKLIAEGRTDVVYGSRFLGTRRVFLFWHYLGNRFLTFVTNILYNTVLSDMETCYKAMRADVVHALNLKSNGFEIEPEMTAKILKRGYRVYEIPVTYDGRGYDEGKKISWWAGIEALWTLLKYRIIE